MKNKYIKSLLTLILSLLFVPYALACECSLGGVDGASSLTLKNPGSARIYYLDGDVVRETTEYASDSTLIRLAVYEKKGARYVDYECPNYIKHEFNVKGTYSSCMVSLNDVEVEAKETSITKKSTRYYLSSSVNLYSGPSESFSVVTTVPKGQTIVAYTAELLEGYEWYDYSGFYWAYVTYNGKSGWMNADHCENESIWRIADESFVIGILNDDGTFTKYETKYYVGEHYYVPSVGLSFDEPYVFAKDSLYVYMMEDEYYDSSEIIEFNQFYRVIATQYNENDYANYLLEIDGQEVIVPMPYAHYYSSKPDFETLTFTSDIYTGSVYNSKVPVVKDESYVIKKGVYQGLYLASSFGDEVYIPEYGIVCLNDKIVSLEVNQDFNVYDSNYFDKIVHVLSPGTYEAVYLGETLYYIFGEGFVDVDNLTTEVPVVDKEIEAPIEEDRDTSSDVNEETSSEPIVIDYIAILRLLFVGLAITNIMATIVWKMNQKKG